MDKDIAYQTVITHEYSIRGFKVPFSIPDHYDPGSINLQPTKYTKGQEISYPSQGFLHLSSRNMSTMAFRAEYGLRQCGYLFWDKVDPPVYPRTNRCRTALAWWYPPDLMSYHELHFDDVMKACAVLRNRFPDLPNKAEIEKMAADCNY